MKKLILTISTLICIQSTQAQFTTVETDFNNVNATISNGGVFFHKNNQLAPGFEYPNGSSNHLIYSTSFWFSSVDTEGMIKLSGQMEVPGEDLFPGAITPGAATSVPGELDSKKVVQVSKAEILDHIANYSTAGYVVPNSLLDWPAHGDVTLELDFYLAPFVDTDNNGVYEPENGDYPLIRGDYATYMILNDKAEVHASGGDPLGIECHFMFYQYESDDFLDNTVFVNLKVINRSTAPLLDFKVGCFTDPDVGDSEDDYAGCDSTLHLMYAYNGSNSDLHYGSNPPAVGVVNLNKSMDVFGTYFGTGATGLPINPVDFVQNMNGLWKDSSPFTLGGNGYGGTTPTKFMYHGNPNNLGEWSEVDENNTAGDRKMFMATHASTLEPGEEKCFDYAFIVGDGGDHLENVTNLMTVATEAKNFFDLQTDFVCENYAETLSLKENTQKELHIYPVPSYGDFTIDFSGEYDVFIYGLDGRKVFEQQQLSNSSTIKAEIQPGSYIVTVIQNNNRYTKSIIIK